MLRLWCGDDHDEVQEVHQVVHGALDAIHHAALGLTDVFLEELGHSKVKGPQACAAVTMKQTGLPVVFRQ